MDLIQGACNDDEPKAELSDLLSDLPPETIERSVNQRLGICIPTYKRPAQLRACVESVIIAGRDSGTPIFISDDSTDGTNSLVIDGLIKSYPYLYYSKNDKNLGIDRNIVKAIDICHCEYAWPLGEDDRLLPNAIDKVLNVIASYPKIPFVFANYYGVDNDVVRIVTEKKINLEEDSELGARTFFEEHISSVGFIGSCVINRALWDSVEKEKYIGTYFAHVGATFEYLYGKRVYLIAEPLVLNRAENQDSFTWIDNFFEVHFGFGRMLGQLRNIYGEDSYVKAVARSKHILYNPLRTLCSFRAENRYDIQKYRAYVMRNKGLTFYELFARVIAQAPVAFFKSVKILYSFLKKPLKGRGLGGAIIYDAGKLRIEESDANRRSVNR